MTFLRFTLLFLIISFSTHAQWAWMHGTQVSSSPVFGTLGIPDSTVIPHGVYEPVPWTDSNNNFWLLGGRRSDGNQVSAFWKFDPSINMWTWMGGNSSINLQPTYGTKGIPSLTNFPGARSLGASSWTDLDGNLWLYGGGNGLGSTTRGDLWKYNPITGEWTWMQGSSSILPPPHYGTLQVPDEANTPGNRKECLANWVDDNGNLWLYGGANDLNAPYSDMWMYDLSTNLWTWMSGDKGCALANFDSLYTFSIDNTPGCRMTYGHWRDLSGNFWLFGGESYIFDETIRADLWQYSTDLNEWAWMGGFGDYYENDGYALGISGTYCQPASEIWPRMRHEGSTSWTDDCGNFWMYGGDYEVENPGGGGMSDLWKYDVQSKQWTMIAGGYHNQNTTVYGTKGVADVANSPGAQCGAVSFKDAGGNFWLYGGALQWTELDDVNQDLWRFSPNDCPEMNGCTLSPHADFKAIDTFVCAGACASFTDLSQNNATSWNWIFEGSSTNSSAQQNPDSICYPTPGFYDVTLITLTANGFDTLTIPNYIHVFGPLIFYIDYNVNSNYLYKVLAPNASFETQWQFNGIDIPGATGTQYTPVQSGNYTCKITHIINGCVFISDPFFLLFTGGISQYGIPEVSIHPVPADNLLNITFQAGLYNNVTFELMDLAGKKIQQWSHQLKSSGDVVSLDVSTIPPGVYAILMESNSFSIRRKIIISRY